MFHVRIHGSWFTVRGSWFSVQGFSEPSTPNSRTSNTNLERGTWNVESVSCHHLRDIRDIQNQSTQRRHQCEARRAQALVLCHDEHIIEELSNRRLQRCNAGERFAII